MSTLSRDECAVAHGLCQALHRLTREQNRAYIVAGSGEHANSFTVLWWQWKQPGWRVRLRLRAGDRILVEVLQYYSEESMGTRWYDLREPDSLDQIIQWLDQRLQQLTTKLTPRDLKQR